MRLVNETPVRALLLPWRHVDESITVTLIVKATYDIGPDGQLSLSPAEEQLPLIGEVLRTPFGIFHTDELPRKEGVDVVVLGTVRRREPVTSAALRIRIGTYENGLRVTGNRRWEKRLFTGSLHATAPEPFTEMPVSYERAFGSPGSLDPLRAPWPDNPEGVGFYMEAEHAEGQPLPNIEPAQGPFVTAWSDRPPVAGWGPYPMFWGLRAHEAIRVDTEARPPQVVEVRFRMFNNAHPALVLPEIGLDEAVAVEGLSDDPIHFRLEVERSRARVRLGLRTTTLETRVDCVCLWADQRRVVVMERGELQYDYDRRKRREAVLVRGRFEGDPSAVGS